jgi:hypothetical protein
VWPLAIVVVILVVVVVVVVDDGIALRDDLVFLGLG